MLAEIRASTRSPGRAFGAAPVEVLVPDVFVRQAPDGSWLVELNPDTLPRVLVNQTYYARVSKPRGERRRQGLPVRMPAERQLARPAASTSGRRRS